MKYRKVFYSEKLNKVRSRQNLWTSDSTMDLSDGYEYIGSMTQVELDLLIEALFEKYGIKDITHEQFETMFGDVRTFCDILKGILEK